MFAAKLGFAELFSDMSLMVVVCLAVSLALIVTDMFQPTGGVGSGCGAGLMLLGIVLRMLAGGTAGELFLLTFIIVTALFIAHHFMLFRQKRLWLYQSLHYVPRTAESERAGMVGLEGVTTTDVAPDGHMSINDVIFCVSSAEKISKGELVRVKRIDGDKIIVERAAQDAIDSYR